MTSSSPRPSTKPPRVKTRTRLMGTSWVAVSPNRLINANRGPIFQASLLLGRGEVFTWSFAGYMTTLAGTVNGGGSQYVRYRGDSLAAIIAVLIGRVDRDDDAGADSEASGIRPDAEDRGPVVEGDVDQGRSVAEDCGDIDVDRDGRRGTLAVSHANREVECPSALRRYPPRRGRGRSLAGAARRRPGIRENVLGVGIGRSDEYAVGRNTIKRILKEQGIEPAPLRRRQYSWATFIKAHLNAIAAADFFTVEVLSRRRAGSAPPPPSTWRPASADGTRPL